MGLARGCPEGMGMWNIFVLWLRRVGIDWLGGLNGRRSRRQGLADTELHPPSPPTAFLSWFRNGLLASGIGVISFMQSDMGREAAYGEYRALPFPRCPVLLPHLTPAKGEHSLFQRPAAGGRPPPPLHTPSSTLSPPEWNS